MVHPSGHIKVLDFGLAKGTPSGDGDDATLSAPGRIAGTPRAMSPEQARGYSLDARSDLFSLGVLLYELLTARSLFSARSFHETLVRVLTHLQPPAHSFDSRIPPELSKLVDHLLEKDRNHRPGSAGEVAEALERIAARSRATQRAPDSLLDAETLVRSTSEGEAVIRTLLVSDFVGSTELVEKLGDRDAAAQ